MINITLWATGTRSQIARIAANNAIAEHQDPEMSVGLDIAVIRMWRGMEGLVFSGTGTGTGTGLEGRGGQSGPGWLFKGGRHSGETCRYSI